jgi:hypothetical protein
MDKTYLFPGHAEPRTREQWLNEGTAHLEKERQGGDYKPDLIHAQAITETPTLFSEANYATINP